MKLASAPYGVWVYGAVWYAYGQPMQVYSCGLSRMGKISIWVRTLTMRESEINEKHPPAAETDDQYIKQFALSVNKIVNHL